MGLHEKADATAKKSAAGDAALKVTTKGGWRSALNQ
jgi:hypothetical protein